MTDLPGSDASDRPAAGAADGPTLRDRTVLVTGGAGFVGSHLASALCADNDVRVLDDLSAGTREAVPGGASLRVGDVTDPEDVATATADVDVVFHLAGEVSVESSMTDPLSTHETNVTGTLRVLEAARDEGARVVFASSAAVYGHPGSIPVSEDDPIEPTSPYGTSKLAAEAYVRQYARSFGLPTVALRYFNVFGPGQRSADYSAVIDVFLGQAARDAPITVDGDGTQTRDFVHVDDVVRANMLAATTDATGEVFNVGTGRSVTIRELAETICDLTGADSEIVHGEPRPGDIEHSQADLSRARSALGYEPSIPLSEGLERLVAATADDSTTGDDPSTADDRTTDGGSTGTDGSATDDG